MEAPGAFEKPAQMLSTPAAHREGPTEPGEPAVLFRCWTDLGRAWRGAEARERKRDAGRVGATVDMASRDRRLVGARGDRLAARAAQQPPRILQLLTLACAMR